MSAAVPAPPPPELAELAGWHRLHPLSPLVKAGRGLIVLVVVLLVALGRSGHVDVGQLISDGAVVVVLAGFGVISWVVTRWQVAGGALRVETGLVRRSSQRYPLSQVQAIDVVQTGLARVLGLAELRLRLAGTGEAGTGRLACLPVAEAHSLRDRLLAVSHGEQEDAPRAVESPLFAVDNGRLVASILLSGMGVIVTAIVVVVVVLAIVNPGALGAVLSGSAAAIVALGTGVYRRFNGDFGMRLTIAADGLHLRSGLVETTVETIPIKRVQAVRLVEPLLWKPCGWQRLEIEVAGKSKRQENQAEGRQRRALVPVGAGAEAAAVLQRLIPDAPVAGSRAPSIARWKAPLSWHNLAWGRNDVCAVTTSGRVRRVSHWVGFAKVQSIRRTQGPVQRRLGLASLHLDTAGRSIHAVLKDRRIDEVDRELAALPDLARTARRAEAAPHPST